MEETTISSNLRVNEAIRVPKVRVISETGEQIGIIPTREALMRAVSVGLDLVEVAPKENPPVCKIMDYGKWKYQQQKKLHHSKKKQPSADLKELRIRPKTDQHDLQIKLDKARAFLEEGHKVQFTMIFRGRERQHPDIGKEIFSDIANRLADISKPEKDSRFEGRRMFMVLSPNSKKPSGSAKTKTQEDTPPNNATDVADTTESVNDDKPQEV